MNILLCPNLNRQNGLRCTQLTAEKLVSLGARPMMDEAYREPVGEIAGCVYGNYRQLLKDCQALMPIGGDGTILGVVQDAVSAAKPILAVNGGRVGFLTQLEMDELDHLHLLLDGKYTVQRRMMVEVELEDGRKFGALNDVVISRGDVQSIADIQVCQEETLIAEHRADGIIFATPSGSTAYSLSAGGPISDPGMKLIIMTTICPHSTFRRSLLLPAQSKSYTVIARSDRLIVSADGRRVDTLFQDHAVTVRGSSDEVMLIDLGLREFYSRVNEKLSWRR